MCSAALGFGVPRGLFDLGPQFGVEGARMLVEDRALGIDQHVGGIAVKPARHGRRRGDAIAPVGRAVARPELRRRCLQEAAAAGRADTQLAMLRRQATVKFDADTGSRPGALLDGVSDQAAFDELSAAIVNGAKPAGLLECAADARRRAAEPKLPVARIRRDLTGDVACRASPERRASAMGSRHRTATDSPMLADTHQGFVVHPVWKPEVERVRKPATLG